MTDKCTSKAVDAMGDCVECGLKASTSLYKLYHLSKNSKGMKRIICAVCGTKLRFAIPGEDTLGLCFDCEYGQGNG